MESEDGRRDGGRSMGCWRGLLFLPWIVGCSFFLFGLWFGWADLMKNIRQAHFFFLLSLSAAGLVPKLWTERRGVVARGLGRGEGWGHF